MYGDYLKLFLHLERAEVNEYTPWTGLLCGGLAEVPHVLYSSGPGLVLEFHSATPKGNNSGFRGTFRFIDKSKYNFSFYRKYNFIMFFCLFGNGIFFLCRTMKSERDRAYKKFIWVTEQ